MNKVIILTFALFFLGSCAHRLSYLPEPNAIGISPYGSYIHIGTESRFLQQVDGELLAVEGDTLIIGSLSSQQLYYIDTSKVINYHIQFCSQRNFTSTGLIAISHGWWMILTMPFNGIISSYLNYKEKKDSRYYNLKFDKLYQFSRYPQGLPNEFKLMYLNHQELGNK